MALQAVASEHPNEYLRKREETTNKPPSGRIGVIDGLDVIDDEVVATCEYVATEGGAAYRSWTHSISNFTNPPISSYRTRCLDSNAFARILTRAALPGLCTTEEGRVKPPVQPDPTGHGTLARFHDGCACGWCRSHARESGCLCAKCLEIRAGSPYVEPPRPRSELPPARP